VIWWLACDWAARNELALFSGFTGGFRQEIGACVMLAFNPPCQQPSICDDLHWDQVRDKLDQTRWPRDGRSAIV